MMIIMNQTGEEYACMHVYAHWYACIYAKILNKAKLFELIYHNYLHHLPSSLKQEIVYHILHEFSLTKGPLDFISWFII